MSIAKHLMFFGLPLITAAALANTAIATSLSLTSTSYLLDGSGFTNNDFWRLEGRVGGQTTWEIGLGNDTHANSQHDNAQQTWLDEVSVPFTFTWDGDTASMSLADGAPTVSWDNVAGDFNAVRIRTTSHTPSSKLGEGSSLTLGNLAVNGVALDTDVSATSGSSYQDNRLYIAQADAFENLIITGEITFDFAGGIDAWTKNAGSRMTFTFDVGQMAINDGAVSNNNEAPVHEPVSAALVLTGLLACAAGRRRMAAARDSA